MVLSNQDRSHDTAFFMVSGQQILEMERKGGSLYPQTPCRKVVGREPTPHYVPGLDPGSWLHPTTSGDIGEWNYEVCVTNGDVMLSEIK